MEINNLRGLAVFMLSIALIISIGCEGPEGLQGPQGEQGPDGPQGPPGEDGVDGNANVLVKTITVTNQNYIDDFLSAKHSNNTLFFFPAKIANIEDPDITEDIVANGLVLAYIQVPIGLGFEPTQWTSLPYTYRHINQIYTANYSSAYSLNTFSLAFYFTRNTEGIMPNIRDWNVPDNTIKYICHHQWLGHEPNGQFQSGFQKSGNAGSLFGQRSSFASIGLHPKSKSEHARNRHPACISGRFESNRWLSGVPLFGTIYRYDIGQFSFSIGYNTSYE